MNADPIHRISRLLALATSENIYEASSAKREAVDVMLASGVTFADVADVEVVTEGVDGREDFILEEVACAVAASRGLSLSSGTYGIRFRGPRRVVHDARRLYEDLVRKVETAPPVDVSAEVRLWLAAKSQNVPLNGLYSLQTLDISSAPVPASASLAWAECFRLGFVVAVQQSIPQPKAKKRKKEDVVVDEARVLKTQKAVQATIAVFDRLKVDLVSAGVPERLAEAESHRIREGGSNAGSKRAVEVDVKPLKWKPKKVPCSNIRALLPAADPRDVALADAVVWIEELEAAYLEKAALEEETRLCLVENERRLVEALAQVDRLQKALDKWTSVTKEKVSSVVSSPTTILDIDF